MFKSLSVLAFSGLLLPAASASAQFLAIHDNPSKAAYESPAEWIMPDAQCHWVPGDGSPDIDPPNTLTHDMAHAHIAVKAPVWAELDGPVTVTVPIKLFHAAGRYTILQAFFVGPDGPKPIPITLDKPLPLVGDPNGLVTATATMTINPADGLSVGVPEHGWFTVRVLGRVVFDNNDRLDVQNFTSYYSMLDPTQLEPKLNEAGINLSARCENVTSHSSTVDDVYGTQLVEFREELPILSPLTAPITLHNFSYAYGFDHDLPGGRYELDLDPDLHMGVPGTALTFKTTSTAGGRENVDTIFPGVLAGSTPPMGYPPNVHKLLAAWVQPTGDAPIVGHDGGMIAPGLLLKTLLAIDIPIADGIAPTPPPPPAGSAPAGPPPAGPPSGGRTPSGPPACIAGATSVVTVSGKLYLLMVNERCAPSVIGPL